MNDNSSKSAMHNDLVITYVNSKREVKENERIPLAQTERFRALY